MSTTRDRFWDLVCLFSAQAYVFLAVSAALLFLMWFSWRNATPGTTAHALIRLNVVILAANVVVLTVIIRRCNARDL
ncbi:hypothetical protein OB955_06065 [Halobacteria archaeon AArc-m2/3/4]|uniref:Uncharacterized protein n=1 Tax=Natronoglomus mannanivorans TaxID=2979990 RepID=A0AAP2Z3R3_9EURY|nr:hypothetical protein [Halobacteria archaeon AArc-xg1-1]MCU4972300.1 hypothetical protein [Halobacteria archaeon AArc-m2/3/4]